MVGYPENYYGVMDPTYASIMANTVYPNYRFGAPTPASKALQLPEIAKLGMSGIQNVEIGVIDPQHWEAIPEKHFEEMKQLAKLQLGKKALISVHAPIQPDPGGFAENRWSEDQRQYAQEFLKDVIDKASKVQVDKDVPVPVTIHGSTQAAMQWKWEQAENKGKGGLVEEMKYVIDPESGQIAPVKRETVEYPEGPRHYTTDDRLNVLNNTQWLQKQQEITAMQAELLRSQNEIKKVKEDNRISEDEADKLINKWTGHMISIKQNFDSSIANSFDHAMKVLNAYIETTSPDSEEHKKYEEQYKQFQNIQNQAKQKTITEDEANQKAAELIYRERTPFFMPVETWAQHQSAKTFADLADYSYKNYGDKGPFISVENWQPGLAMGRGASLKKGLDEAREIFAKKLMARNIPESKARAIAAEKIKATWDIGHINILKRYGIPAEGKTEEEKRQNFWKKHIEPEIKEIQDYLGHIHISDNFGYQDVHLPPGMGNTPIKEFLEHLEKEGKLKNIRAILESSGAAIHLGIPPSHTEALQYFNSPLYPGITGPVQTWGNVSNNYFFGAAGAGYSSGYGKFLPEGHFSEYGTGFSQLPYSLGGQRGGGQGDQSKFSGTPMS
ncbi:MAG: TIM barrel protein [archaeon]